MGLYERWWNCFVLCGHGQPANTAVKELREVYIRECKWRRRKCYLMFLSSVRSIGSANELPIIGDRDDCHTDMENETDTDTATLTVTVTFTARAIRGLTAKEHAFCCRDIQQSVGSYG